MIDLQKLEGYTNLVGATLQVLAGSLNRLLLLPLLSVLIKHVLTANNGSAIASKEEIVMVTTGLKSQLNGTDQTLADLEETFESGLNLDRKSVV